MFGQVQTKPNMLPQSVSVFLLVLFSIFGVRVMTVITVWICFMKLWIRVCKIKKGKVKNVILIQLYTSGFGVFLHFWRAGVHPEGAAWLNLTDTPLPPMQSDYNTVKPTACTGWEHAQLVHLLKYFTKVPFHRSTLFYLFFIYLL